MFRDVYFAAHSGGRSCQGLLTSPFRLGSLGVISCLRHRSLVGVLARRACRVTLSFWKRTWRAAHPLHPVCYFAFLGIPGCLRGALLGRSGDCLPHYWDHWEPSRGVFQSLSRLGGSSRTRWGFVWASGVTANATQAASDLIFSTGRWDKEAAVHSPDTAAEGCQLARRLARAY